MMMEKLVEWRLAGETEVLGEKYPTATSSTTNPTWPDPGSNPGRRGGKPATNRLSYGAALKDVLRNYLAVCMSLCVSTSNSWTWKTPVVSRQLLGKHVPAAMATHFGRIFFYATTVVSKENRLLVLPWTSCRLTHDLFSKRSFLYSRCEWQVSMASSGRSHSSHWSFKSSPLFPTLWLATSVLHNPFTSPQLLAATTSSHCIENDQLPNLFGNILIFLLSAQTLRCFKCIVWLPEVTETFLKLAVI
jgi:hypothetical protein